VALVNIGPSGAPVCRRRSASRAAVGVEGDGAATGGAFGFGQGRCAADFDELTADGQGGCAVGGGVEVAPEQSAGLAASQAAQSDEPEQQAHRVGVDAVEEDRGLLGGPDRDRRPRAAGAPGPDAWFGPHHGMRAAAGGQLEVTGGVALDQAAALRGGQRGAQGRAQPGLACRR